MAPPALLALVSIALAGYAPAAVRAGGALRSRVASPLPAAPALLRRACVSAVAPAPPPIGADAALVGALAPRARAALAARVALGGAVLLAARPALAAAVAAAGAPAAKLHIGQKLALKLGSSGLPDELVLALISMLPVVELRGAVPVGSWLGVSPLRTLIVCVLGNTFAVVCLLGALRLPAVERLLAPVLDKARSKMGALADAKSLPLGLAVFVGVPLPGTGGWTGAMIAHLLGMPFGLACASISAGVLMAGLIMTALTLAGWYGALVASGVLAIFCAGTLLKRGGGGA
ncbi:hypothetical protein KFE25_014425 [Diacronema lutheri]|uniref:Small multi-drug export protein n=2 Tax=Diacronema lutheri TaxID=2081491 RepID=A0A8J6C2J5_DIALT|nr:hypothetical protein KFE25_014425 [Diacronema lutheri]